MRFWRNKISPSVLLITLLAILLSVLASLQYRWLTEISAAERERLQARLQTDARRFSQDFNGEITRAFYTFQIDSQILLPENSKLFAERYALWRSQTSFPGIVKTIFLISKESNDGVSLKEFNPNSQQFEKTDWTDETASLRDKITDTSQRDELETSTRFEISRPAIDENLPALIIPVQELLTEKAPLAPGLMSQSKRVEYLVNVSKSFPEPHQFIVVQLDVEAMKNEMLPEIFRRHFAEEGSEYNFSVASRAIPDKIIFHSNGTSDSIRQPDAQIGIFEIAPDSSNILILNNGSPRMGFPEQKTVIFHQNIQRQAVGGEPKQLERTTKTSPLDVQNANNVKVRLLNRQVENSPLESRNVDEDNGRWILNVQHADGSLENFVGKTKGRNLGLSFGILALLGSSVLVLVFSTHKLRRAAQKQIDFVSSVSHEFRTPVAVICSAGDNLSDGIVKNPANIEKYGRLIRREGNRLTEMVEQILEFAGAQSGRKKYSLQKTEISPLLLEALADCQSLFDEKDFIVETNIEPDLPKIEVDSKAFRLAVQNLLSNAVKYSDGSREIGISVCRRGEKIVLSIADHGIGIEAGELKHIFEPFFRGKSVVDAQIHGNGLGLSLVKQIVDAHQGCISVESQPHRGSKFTIEFPI